MLKRSSAMSRQPHNCFFHTSRIQRPFKASFNSRHLFWQWIHFILSKCHKSPFHLPSTQKRTQKVFGSPIPWLVWTDWTRFKIFSQGSTFIKYLIISWFHKAPSKVGDATKTTFPKKTFFIFSSTLWSLEKINPGWLWHNWPQISKSLVSQNEIRGSLTFCV